MTYDPVSFWKSRVGVDLGLDNPIHKIHYDAILELVRNKDKDKDKDNKNNPHPHNIESVFEVGCGYGRITKLLLESLPQIKKYDAIDISVGKIDAATKYIPFSDYQDKLNIWSDNFDNPMLLRRPQVLEKGGYDLVIAVECLMHQLPSEISKWMEKMLAMSKHLVINLDWYDDEAEEISRDKDKIAPWNFIHDYDRLYQEIGDKKKKKIPSHPITIYSKQITSNQRIYRVTL